MNVYLNTANMSSPDVANWVSYNSWLWDLRTGCDVDYQGTTSNTAPGSGEMLIRMATSQEWTTYNNSGVNANAITISQNGGKIIFINPNIAITPQYEKLIEHEMGHALGYFSLSGIDHSPDPDDVMYPIISNQKSITTADVFGVRIGTALPYTHAMDVTSSVLMLDNDLFIPDISGYQAHLDYVGVVNGKQTWNLASYTANEESQGSASTFTGTHAHLHSVQTMGQDYVNVELSVVGTVVQLESLQLA